MRLAIPKRITRLPDWLWNHQEDDKQISEDMLSISFWEKINEDIEKAGGDISARDKILSSLADEYVLSRRLAEAANNSFDVQSNLPEELERARIRTLIFMRNNDLFRSVEASGVTDFLLEKVDPDNPYKNGINSEIEFIVNTLLPVLGANKSLQIAGDGDDVFIGIKRNYTKLRVLVAPLRRVLAVVMSKVNKIYKQLEAENDPVRRAELEKEYQAALVLDEKPKEMLQMYLDSLVEKDKSGRPITVASFKEKINRVSTGVQQTHVESMLAKTAIMPENKTILMLEINDNVQLQIVMQALGAHITVQQSNVYEMVDYVSGLVTGTKIRKGGRG